MRPLLAFACLTTIASAPAFANDEPRVTRIEPRPFYGATVTVEHGVRVYRSLPPHRDIVIAPDEGPTVELNLGGGNSTRTEHQRRDRR